MVECRCTNVVMSKYISIQLRAHQCGALSDLALSFVTVLVTLATYTFLIAIATVASPYLVSQRETRP